jgi:hypothetical protein
MKIPFITVLLLTHVCAAMAQHITHVTPQTVGTKIILHYNLEETTEDQLFEVALYSSRDDYAQALKSVSGNGVGTSVSGGAERVIIWDVLKDIDQLKGEITFEVRALVKSRITEITTMSGASSRNLGVASKDDAYNIISTVVSDYINEAKDLKDAFMMLGVQATESRQALSKLTDAMEQYNRAFENLNKERLTFEKYVGVFWKRDVLTLEFKNLMDYTLGDVHAVNILTLNQKVSVINDIANARIRRPGEAKKELAKDISLEVAKLDKQLQELDRRSNRLLYQLGEE